MTSALFAAHAGASSLLIDPELVLKASARMMSSIFVSSEMHALIFVLGVFFKSLCFLCCQSGYYARLFALLKMLWHLRLAANAMLTFCISIPYIRFVLTTTNSRFFNAFSGSTENIAQQTMGAASENHLFEKKISYLGLSQQYTVMHTQPLIAAPYFRVHPMDGIW